MHDPFALSSSQLKQITQALLREWASDIAVTQRGTFVDFDVQATGVLGLPDRQRFRLFFHAVEDADLAALIEEANAGGQRPVAIIPFGAKATISRTLRLNCIGPEMFDRLIHESGVVVRRDERIEVDRAAFGELKDHADASVALLNGLLWLRPLSRNRCPPALRWSGTRPDELFERCFFLTMTSTFLCSGESWGSRHRGKPVPDGVLFFPGVADPVLYDCKASREGFKMDMPDLRTCADYLSQLSREGWVPPPGTSPRFLFVSSEFQSGSREASFAGRQTALQKRVPGARMTWIRTPDLVRFGLAIERNQITSVDRAAIVWLDLLDAGQVAWNSFAEQLVPLRGAYPGLERV